MINLNYLIPSISLYIFQYGRKNFRGFAAFLDLTHNHWIRLDWIRIRSSPFGFYSAGFGCGLHHLDSIRMDSDSSITIWIRFGWIRIRS